VVGVLQHNYAEGMDPPISEAYSTTATNHLLVGRLSIHTRQQHRHQPLVLSFLFAGPNNYKSLGYLAHRGEKDLRWLGPCVSRFLCLLLIALLIFLSC
jgi:hypothetical protein